VEGGPASDVDLRAGDLLLAVGSTEVASAETAARVLQSAAPHAPTELRIIRDGRVRTVQVTPATAYEVAVAARAARALGSTLPEARVLFTAAQLESARIPPGARVVSVGGRNVSSRTQLQRQLRGAKQPVLVLLRHGDRQFFASIAQTR
jgi:S1-C subfamily serine protease